MTKAKRKFIKRFCLLISVFVLFFVILAMGNSKETFITYNVNNVKSIEAVHIVSKYTFKVGEQIPTLYDAFSDVLANGADHPVSFVGTLTGYGPDCVGCSGKVGCPPRPNVFNGNIYFEDVEYGKLRIVATDSGIPCGSIVKISNYKFSDGPLYAIALDRGGAIKGKTMDLLYASESETRAIGRQYNIQFDLIRWGW